MNRIWGSFKVDRWGHGVPHIVDAVWFVEALIVGCVNVGSMIAIFAPEIPRKEGGRG